MTDEVRSEAEKVTVVCFGARRPFQHLTPAPAGAVGVCSMGVRITRGEKCSECGAKPNQNCGAWPSWAEARIAELEAQNAARPDREAELRAEIERLTRERDEARAVLAREDVEWGLTYGALEAIRSGYGEMDRYCPVCHDYNANGHAPDCALARALHPSTKPRSVDTSGASVEGADRSGDTRP